MKQSHRLRRRTFYFVLFLILFILLTTRVYMMGMDHLEQRPRGFWRSLMTVVETITTTGFGHDDTWNHPVMTLYVIFLQVSGLFLFFLIFPLYFIPFFERRFEQRLPDEARDLQGHVIIYCFSQAVSSLLRELERAGQPVLLLEEDEAEARRLWEQEHRVVHHRSVDDAALAAAGLLQARTLVCNGRDSDNASLCLAARQLGFRGEILTLVEDPTYVEPMMLAGSNEVLTPRHLLAAALAARASERVSPTIAGAHQLGHKLEICQIRVAPESRLAGLSLGQAALGARTGAIVIGQWVGGRLETAPGAGMVIEPRGILVVAASRESIEKLERLAEGARTLTQQGPFVVVGSGEVGGQVVELLRQAGERVVVIDRRQREGVDIVGDILDPDIIEQAGIESAQAVILAIDSDPRTLFAAVIIRDRCARVPILARVNETANLEKLHRAGADFALSFSQVAGSLLASRLLGQHAFELDPQLKLLKVGSGRMEGKAPSELDLRRRTGCSIIGVERGNELFTEFDADFRFLPEDEVYVCGSERAIERFQDAFGG
ncbi:MAG: NAD-binding protein [Candidatus Krumholzibacteriota bacterium]|nr:NAD-binding protein [Candidatus Krumholzibacteriota bacterium]